MRGRKPQPTKLKILTGNPGHRRLNANEPIIPTDLPACPDHLDTEAKTKWASVTAVLGTSGLLTQADGDTLAAYCQCWSDWVNARVRVSQLGLMLVSKETGQLYPNPYLHVANRAMREMTRLAAELGLTASSRSRLQPDPSKTNADPFQAFLNRAKKTS
jgi:P27 family predicted phage terminase small subunit